MIHIERVQEGNTDIVTLAGEIDASSSIALDKAIAESVAAGFTSILVDCSSLEYISSAGLGVFMSYIDELKDKNITMVLYGMNSRVENTFSILGLHQLLKIETGKAEAKKIIDAL